MSKNVFRDTLLASTVIAGMTMLSAPAFAQQVPDDGESAAVQVPEGVQPQAGEPAEETSTGEIVVTGTLIRNPNLVSSSPVTVVGQDEIDLQQSNVAEEILRELPGVVPSIGSAVNNGNGGNSYVNLRGLGSNRNIVLLDGVRIVPADLQGRVDLNNIPLALVERVDSLTGGASTTYGADAVSGVVNFITRRDFAGAELTASNQITEDGDGHIFRVDATIGANFDDGRGNAVVGIGYQEADPVFQGARAVSLETIETFSGTAIGSGTSVPSRFSGTRNLAGTANQATSQLDPNTGAIIPTFQTFNFNPFNVFQVPFERFNMYAAGHYEVSDAIEIYTRGLFSKNTVQTIIAPSGAFGIAVQIPLSNPFLPAAARNQFCAFDVNPSPTVYTPRFTPAECAAAATAQPGQAAFRQIGTGGFVPFDVNGNGTIQAGEGFNPNPQVALFRRSVEAGPRTSTYINQVFDYRLGLRGSLTDAINWDVFGSYGESEQDATIGGYFLNSRVRQSLLAVPGPTGPRCIDPANGCVPANFFGAAGTIQQEAIPFLTGPSTVTTRTTLAQARATVSGDLGFTSPLATEGLGFAVGGEYREYGAAQLSDPTARSGDLGGAGGASPDISGGFHVYEAFGEIIAPLIADRPFFELLQLEAGFRRSQYTVRAPSEPSFSTDTYKIGGKFEPFDGIQFRGNYSRAVRAPNIGELFSPVNTGLVNLGTDPCATLSTSGAVLPGRPATGPTGELRAVCLAQGANAGNINQIPEPISGQVLATGGGNVNIRPETADSYTIGVVLQPSFLRGFSATADYYNIKIKRAISAPTPGDVIAACFGANVFSPAAGASSDPACTSIRRDPLTGGLSGDPNTSTGLPSTLTNGGRLETEGVDLVVSYRRDLGAMFGESVGDVGLALSFAGNYTIKNSFNAFVANPLGIDRDCVGFFSSNCGSLQPEFQWSQRTTLSFGDTDVSLLWRHIDSLVQEPLDVEASGPFFSGTIAPTLAGVGGRTVNFGRIKAYDYFDLTFRFEVSENFTFTTGVQNLLDKKPPLVGNNAGTTTFNSGNTFPSTYDALGRRYGATARLRF